MEESEKRRERLKAMRLEATTSNQSVSSSSQQQTLNHSTPLANPLLDNPDSNSAASIPPPRFDFYTDPMAAYATSDKRRPPNPPPHFPQSSFGPRNDGIPPPSGVQQHQSNFSPRPLPAGVQQHQNNYRPQPPPAGVQQHQNNYRPQPPPSGAQQFQNNYGPQSPCPSAQNFQNNYAPQPPPPGVHQFQNSYGPHHGMYQGGDPYYSPGPHASPMGMRSPYPGHQGSPNFSNAPGRGNWFNNNSSPGSGCGDQYPMYQGSPDIRPPPQGRGHWSNNSPRPGQGPGYGGGPSPRGERGRGQWNNNRMSSGSGNSSGRGYGDSQAQSFYNNSMVEDPWKSLTPVIWQADKENDARSYPNNRGYFQKTSTSQITPTAKKPRVSNTFDVSNSKKGGSLADFLAESFDEAVEDTAAV